MIYDEIYAEDKEYNYRDVKKIQLVYRWLKKNKLTNILDVGCGKGHYLKYFTHHGLKVIGLEPSQYACKHYLEGYNVINHTILEAVGKWDGLYCMDVLEHLSYDDIDNSVAKLADFAPEALFGIANHSDMWRQTELHSIQEDSKWWSNTLSKYYENVEPIKESETYYVFSASNR